MADALELGKPLDDEQLAGWRGIDFTRQAWLLLSGVLVGLVIWGLRLVLR